jgi:phosphoribosylformylglycinamidine cyclo-ligase
MCVNDIICGGAAPLFFLDYIACGKNDPVRIAEIVSGITEGCRQAGCALVGGETAEHPGMMAEADYDLAGFSVGIVDQEKIIDGAKLAEGDVLIGIASSGVHSNGFSLVRKVFGITDSRDVLDEYVTELGETIGEALLRPTRIYVRAIQGLLDRGIHVHAISHITGGGLYENVPRMMTDGLTAQIQASNIPVPPIFTLIAQRGNIPERDMYNTFNMGVGMILAVSKDEVGRAMEALIQAGERAYVIGSVVKGDSGVELV